MTRVRFAQHSVVVLSSEVDWVLCMYFCLHESLQDYSSAKRWPVWNSPCTSVHKPEMDATRYGDIQLFIWWQCYALFKCPALRFKMWSVWCGQRRHTRRTNMYANRRLLHLQMHVSYTPYCQLTACHIINIVENWNNQRQAPTYW